MNPRTRTLTAVLSGAVVLASGAYAVGSQSNDGNASAADTARVAKGYGPGPGGPRGDHGLDLAAAAKKLGVSESKLQAALQDLRGARRDKRGRGPDDLAKALGVSQSKLQKAFQNVQEKQRKAFASALAKELGVSTSTVNKAFKKERSEHAAKRDDMAARLAKKLGVSKSKVESALGRPGGPGGAGPRLRSRHDGPGPGFGGPPGIGRGPGGPPPGAPAPPAGY